MKAYLIITMVGGALFLSGCNRVARKDAREQNNPLVTEAYAQIDAGAFREAARLLREALDLYPTMARPHLDLAMILHEHRGDYVRAIYHYQRYLELRPGTEKEGMIQQRMADARAALVVAYGGRPGDPAVLEEKMQSLAEAQVARATAEAAVAESRQTQKQLLQDLAALRVELAQREEQVQMQQRELQQMRGQVQRLEAAAAQAVGGGAVAADRPELETDVGATAPDPPRTYEVRANDTLSVIAHRVYGDAMKWRLIQEANREVLGDSDTLRIGQVLIIPDVENRR